MDVFQEKVGLVAIPVAPSVGEERVGGGGMVGTAVIVSVTGILAGLPCAPVAVTMIVAVYVPAVSPVVLILAVIAPAFVPDVGERVSQVWLSVALQVIVPPPVLETERDWGAGLVP